MASESEPAKLLLPYLQRADELQKHEPLVAYYCRLYAMERGLKIPANNRTKTTSALLVSLMNQLEKVIGYFFIFMNLILYSLTHLRFLSYVRSTVNLCMLSPFCVKDTVNALLDKKSLKLGPDDHLHVEGFALNVFAKADKQDRAGRADLNTAKTFYAASLFFEILNQFGEVHPELEQKQRYAVWKAADIRRALKEGREPQPGPPAEYKDLSTTSNGEDDSEQTNHDSTIRYNSSDASATVTHDSGTLSDSNSSRNLLNISQKSSSDFPTHSTSMDVSPPHNKQPSDNNQSYNLGISQQSSNVARSPSMDIPSPHNYPSDNNQTQSFHQSLPPPINSQPYHHQQPYQPEHQKYPSHQEVPSYSYPNFQSYPSFTDSSVIPSSYSSYYQNSPNADVAYSPSYLSSVQHESTNGSVSQDSSTKYEYDSNYQPPPEKISEAHKAARFAVGALAFDDVATAVEHLKKSLELLTNPSVGN